jgi:AraC-like DNA-binding protein
LVISIVSYSIGAAVFFLGLYLFLLYRAQLIKYFLILQVLFMIDIALNGIYEYVMISWRGSHELLAAWSVVSFIWAPFFFYYAVFYVFYVSAVPFSGWIKRGFKIVSVLIGLTIFIPLFAQRSMHGSSHPLERGVYYVNIPVVLLAGFIALILMSLRFRKMDNAINRTLLLNHIIVELAGIPPIFVLYVVNLTAGRFMEIKLKAAIDIFVLLWNLQMVALFIAFAQKVEKGLLSKRRSARIFHHFNEVGELFSDSLKKYEKSNLSVAVAEKNLKKLEMFMREEKPYLSPELTLVGLSEMLATPRNQLSQILNEYKKQSFNDFLNSYRIEEAKCLLSGSSNPVNVLRVAFDSGFNSKTTFYRVFRKTTGVTPTEYVARMNGRAIGEAR